MLNPIVYAVPVFLAAMGLEWLLARRRGLSVYDTADTVASLSTGILSQLAGVFVSVLALAIYGAVYTHLAPWHLPVDSVAVWLGALLAYDFCYYWLHRLGHELNILWAAHVVHHSSEDYNLGTALRQTATGGLLGWLFYLPMALAGVPPLVFVTVGLIDLLYQFWVHTRLVGRLGWLDRVLVTPSNHRVHHGQNDGCLDRNYGGILILWDRLFGSFVDERDALRPGEPLVYGIRGALHSFDPLRANGHVYAALAAGMRQALARGDWRGALALPLRHPGWRAPGEPAEPPFDAGAHRRHRAALPPALVPGLLGQLALLLALGVHFLAVQPRLGGAASVVIALGLLLQLVGLARLSDLGAAARRGDAWRWAAGALALAASPWHGAAWWLAWLAGGALLARGWWRLRAQASAGAAPGTTAPG